MSSVTGIFVCEPLRAARDAAIPLAEPAQLAAWATQQAGLLQKHALSTDDALECASIVRSFGGKTKSLPIAASSGGALDAAGVAEFARGRNCVRLIHDAEVSSAERDRAPIHLDDDVLAVAMTQTIVLQDQLSSGLFSWPEMLTPADERGRPPMTIQGLVIQIVRKEWRIRDLNRHLKDSKEAYGKRGRERPIGRVRVVTRSPNEDADAEAT